jgi:hypothetical protein
MNKLVTSVGMLALGVSALHAAESSTLTSLQKTKPWTIQATLNGFYDDNVNGSPSGSELESAGVEIIPSVRYGLPGEQTSFNVGYSFGAKIYDEDVGGPGDNRDLTHIFDLDFAHAFSPRFDMAIDEAFVIGQEPDVVQDPAGVMRVDGDNVRNFAGIEFNMAATQLLGFKAGYRNAFFDYDDESGYGAGTPVGYLTGNPPSNSGMLDRLEHTVILDSNWQLSPQTVGVLGYNYSQINYTGDEVIAGIVGAPGQVFSDTRDSRGHTFYVGASQVFSPTLSGNARVGAQYYSYYNSPTTDDGQWSPYAQAGLDYALQSVTTVGVGFRYQRTPANETGLGGSQFIRDSETATLYANLKHEIFSKFFGTLSGVISDSEYNGGGPGVDGAHQVYSRWGLDFSYEFSKNFAGHVGYNYDQVDSDLVGRDYDRNRVYFGVTAGF